MFLGSRLNVPIGESGAGRSQDRFSRSPVNPEFFNEFIKGYAVSQPVEELLHWKSTATKARRPAHAIRIDPNCLFEGYYVFHWNHATRGAGYEYLNPVCRLTTSVRLPPPWFC